MGTPSLLALGLGDTVHTLVLLVDPSSRFERSPVLSGEMVTFVVEHVRVHEFVDTAQVEKWDHGVAVMLGVVVGVPQERPDDNVTADAAGVPQTVRVLGDFAIGVLKVPEVVDHRVAHEDRNDPPKEEAFDSLARLAEQVEHGGVTDQLRNGGPLNGAHDARLLGVGPVLEAPPKSAVVDGHAHGRANDPTNAALEG